MKLISLFAFLCLMAGCQSVGSKFVDAGRGVGMAGSNVLIVSGISAATVPIGIAASVPFFTIGGVTYYMGCILSNKKPERAPFEP